MAKKLAVITWDTAAGELYAQQIQTYFGNDLRIATYSVQAGNINQIAPSDVYLVSTCAFADRDIDQLLPPGGEVVISEVHITRESLSRLLEVPHNTQALLVNINQPMATETIAMLNHLGVTNIRFTPYYPGAPEPPRLACAVTTGERRYVPDWVEEVIDLGPRFLSGDTFFSLAYHLNYEWILRKPEFQAYLSSLAECTYSIEQMLNRSVQLESLADLFQKALDSGVIGVNNNGSVFVCSPKAAEILKIPAERLFSQHVQEVLAFFPFAESIANRKAIHNRMVEHQGVCLNVSIQPFYQQNTLIGAFCVFQQAQDREKRQQKARRQIPAGGHMTKYTFDSIIGESRPMQTAKDLARKMAASSAAILITGESGTGKELFAQAIHAASPRSGSPFVAINCAAMPDSLLESQLFGYEEGAFTGAKKGGHIGFFETACSGTLFLDEIEAMSPMLQVKLLRVLQEKEIVRLGGVDVIHVDVRVIAASNEDLSTIVREGGFRKDLFYRLSVLPLQLPPLRERGLDIQLLLRHIQDNMHASFILSSEALRVLLSYQWEGNVRELRNCVEYLICLEKQVIQPEDLPFNIQASFAHERTIEPQPVPEPAPVRPDAAGQALEQLRRRAGSDLTPYRFLLAQLVLVPSMGRKALSEQAARSGLTLTEQTIRTMMSHLEELKLVEIRRGRGGTQITALGREAARALASQPIKSPI